MGADPLLEVSHKDLFTVLDALKLTQNDLARTSEPVQCPGCDVELDIVATQGYNEWDCPHCNLHFGIVVT